MKQTIQFKNIRRKFSIWGFEPITFCVFRISESVSDAQDNIRVCTMEKIYENTTSLLNKLLRYFPWN